MDLFFPALFLSVRADLTKLAAQPSNSRARSASLSQTTSPLVATAAANTPQDQASALSLSSPNTRRPSTVRTPLAPLTPGMRASANYSQISCLVMAFKLKNDHDHSHAAGRRYHNPLVLLQYQLQ